MPRYSLKRALEQINEVRAEFSKDYERENRETYKEMLTQLSPGAITPANDGRIYNKDRREAFATRCTQYALKVSDIVDDAMKGIDAEIGAAPSTDAVNYISVLSARTNVDAGEINAALKKYGDNYMAYQTIRDIAVKNKIKDIPEHDISKARQTLERERRSAAMDLTPLAAEKGSADPGRRAFIEALRDLEG